MYQDKKIVAIPQKNNFFIAKLEKNDGAPMFFITEKQQKTFP